MLAAWTRRRSFVAFALLFLGTSMGFPFALPFWALGIWLIFRVFKWQKELTAMTGAAGGPTDPDPAPRGGADAAWPADGPRPRPAGGPGPNASGARRGRGARGKKQPEPAGPRRTSATRRPKPDPAAAPGRRPS